MSQPGFRFKEGKLYAFCAESVMILEAWPTLKAIRKDNESYWEEFEPRFRVVQPYRRRKPKKTPQLELGLGESVVVSSISEQRRLAFNGFRFALPKAVAAATEKFQSRQWGILALMQKEEAAVELAQNNPALFFALANARPFRGRLFSPESLAKIALERQRDIAGWLGFPGTEATAKILAKIPPESASVEILAPLRRVLKKPTILKILTHQQNLNAGVLSILLIDGLADAVAPSLLTEIAETPAEKYRASYVDMLVDTLTMLRRLKPNAGIPKIQSLARLRSMHDEVSTEYLRSLPHQTMAGSLPAPPLRGTKTIIPIVTYDELVQEARSQNNCVATYAERIRKRTTFIYRVTSPERATLSIVRGHDGDWRIDELECWGNTRVSAITRLAVESWLDQYALSV